MDQIWDRNPSKSEVIGRCGGDEKRMTTQNRQMSNAKKKKQLLKSFKTKSIGDNSYTQIPGCVGCFFPQ